MVVCATCGAVGHKAAKCAFRSKDPQELLEIFASADKSQRRTGGSAEDANEDYVPLRKRLLRKSTGREDNFVRSYYVVHPDIAALSERDVEWLRRSNDIEVEFEGDPCPRPIRQFRELGLDGALLHRLDALGFKVPTPIQMQSLPCALSGRDIVGIAETGSGKTLAYLLPLVLALRGCPETKAGDGPLALILAPTRELVEQIYSDLSVLLSVYGAIQATRATAPPFAPTAESQQPPHTHVVTPFTPLFSNAYSVDAHLGPHEMSVDGVLPRDDVDEHNDGRLMYATWHSYASQHVTPMHAGPMPPFGVPHQLSSTHALHGDGAADQPPATDVSSASLPIRSILGVCGGVPLAQQIGPLSRGVDVVVATPGRLADLVNRGAVPLTRLIYLVVDEADRMLSMGLEGQLRHLVGMATNVRVARQTLLWSATMPRSLERLARSAVLNPVTIYAGSSRGGTAVNVEQRVLFMHSYQKKTALLDALRRTETPPVIVFCNSAGTVDKVVSLLRSEQFHAAGIHSEKAQGFRFRVMRAFKEGRLDVLVATDVASRGIDVTGVTHVIQFDLAETLEDYLHRCGRTGRAGRTGLATGFLTYECKYAGLLKDYLEGVGQAVPAALQVELAKFGKTVVRTELGDKVVT